jgi:hypothetical protein
LTTSPQLCQKSIASKGPASQATSSRIAGRDHLGISGRHRRNLHFAGLRAKAEQLDAVQRWYRILSEALRKYLHGRQLIPPARLQPA